MCEKTYFLFSLGAEEEKPVLGPEEETPNWTSSKTVLVFFSLAGASAAEAVAAAKNGRRKKKGKKWGRNGKNKTKMAKWSTNACAGCLYIIYDT